MNARVSPERILYTLLTLTWILCCFGPAVAQQPASEATTEVAKEDTELDQSKTVGEFVNEDVSVSTRKGFEELGPMAVVKMLFWVVVITVAIYGGARLLKRYVPAARNMFGTGTLKVVGRTFLSPKQSILLVKVGGRMVVVGVTPTGMTALAEIRDSEELEYISREIDGSGKDGGSKEFQEDLKEASKEFESGQELLESTSPSAQFARGEAKQVELVDGIRSELDSISRKINLWRNASD